MSSAVVKMDLAAGADGTFLPHPFPSISCFIFLLKCNFSCFLLWIWEAQSFHTDGGGQQLTVGVEKVEQRTGRT